MHSSKLEITQKNVVNLPCMEQPHEFMINMQKDLRKWCNENYHIFKHGNGIENEPSISCGESQHNAL